MLSFESRLKLRELLLEIAVHEQQIEVLRQKLAEIPDFEPYAAFRRIDRFRRGYVTASDLFEFLKKNGLKNTEEECELLVSHYDRDNDGRLQFTEFLVSILPLDNPKLRTISTQRKVYDIGYDEFLSSEIEHSLATLFTREIAYQMESDYQKVELANQHDFCLPEAFASVDVKGTGFIAYSNLKAFFKSQGKAVQDYDVVAILRRLDRDEDGKISFEEFAHSIKSQGSGFVRTMKSTGTKTKEGLGRASPRKGTRIGTQASPPRLKLTNSVVPPTLISTLIAKSSPRQKKAESLVATDRSLKTTGDILQKTRNTAISTKIVRVSSKGKDFHNKIILYLKKFINLDREIELSKQDLALQADFNLPDAFKIFASNDQGQLSVSDIERGCTELAINPSKEDIHLFMERFDKDGDRKINFAEFTDAFAPLQPEYYNELRTRVPARSKPDITPSQHFTPHTRKLIKGVFVQHVQNEISAEGIRQKLNSEGAFHVEDVFEFLDRNKCGFITIDQLRVAFERYKVFVTDKELFYLINRFDSIGQNKISFADFAAQLAPKLQ